MASCIDDARVPGLALLDVQQELEQYADPYRRRGDPVEFQREIRELYGRLGHIFQNLEVIELARHFHVLASSDEAADSARKNDLRKYRGQIFSWGENESGCLGQGDASSSGSSSIRPKAVPTLRDFYFSDLACGLSHTVAVTTTGDVFGWGANQSQQLLLQGTTNIPRPLLVGLKVRGISCGAGHTICVTEEGVVYGWGLARNGQLGNYHQLAPTTKACGVVKIAEIPKESPGSSTQQIDSARHFIGVACGFAHSFLLDAQNRLFGCGWNAHGQVGTVVGQVEAKSGSLIPSLTWIIDGIQHIACGGAHTLLVGCKHELFGFGYFLVWCASYCFTHLNTYMYLLSQDFIYGRRFCVK